MLKESLRAYIFLKGTMIVPNTETVAAKSNRNKEVVFKNCAPFTDCISEINNAQVDNAKETDAVMNMYKLTEWNENYSQTSGSLWRYYRDQPALNNDGNIIDFPVNNDASLSFKFHLNFHLKNILDKTVNDGTKVVKYGYI